MGIYTQQIEQLNSGLQSLLPMKPEDKQRLHKKIRLEFSYNSNHLEGNTLTYGETELLLIFDKTTGNHEVREYDEMRSHDAAFELIQEWAADKERPLTEAAIKNLNTILLVKPFWKEAQTPDGQSTRRLITIGDYKQHPNSVRLQNGEMFDYTSPAETPIQMSELIQWFREEEGKAELHPVALAALLHYRFVCIHSFDDGNGRISRLLMNYVLLKNDFPPVIIKSAEKKAYLFALNQADSGNMGAFVEYIEQQLVWSLELFVKAALGESIEEEDDLDKEIAVWKKSLNTITDTLPKSNELIIERYYDSIKPLFKKFIKKYQQFVDLFNESYYVATINELQLGDIKSLENEIEVIASENEKQIEDTKFTFKSIKLDLVFIAFKKNAINVFDIRLLIQCIFKDFDWTITRGNDNLNKLYSQQLTENEIKEFVHKSVHQTFQEIQAKTNNTSSK